MTSHDGEGNDPGPGNDPGGADDPAGVEPDEHVVPIPGAGDPELASHGAAFRWELRAEAAEWERVAALDSLRRRTLADAARELLHRGDRVAVSVAGRRWSGPVVHVGADVACLATTAGLVDVRLDGVAVWEVVERTRAGGASGGGSQTFRARLAAREQAGERIGLSCPGAGTEPTGALVAVAEDHLVLRGPTGRSVLVPLQAVAAVWPG